MSILNKYLWPLVVAVIPVPLTIWLTYAYLQDVEKVNNIEYYEIQQEKLIDFPKEVQGALRIEFNGKNIENISSVDYMILNKSNSNAEGVDFYFEIICDVDSNPCELIGKKIDGESGYSSYGFSEIKSKDKNVIGWKVGSINSNSNVRVKLLFLGDKPPKIKPTLVKPGFSLNKVENDKAVITGVAFFIDESKYMIFAMIFVLLLFFIIFDLYSNFNKIKSFKEKMAQYLESNGVEDEAYIISKFEDGLCDILGWSTKILYRLISRDVCKKS